MSPKSKNYRKKKKRIEKIERERERKKNTMQVL